VLVQLDIASKKRPASAELRMMGLFRPFFGPLTITTKGSASLTELVSICEWNSSQVEIIVAAVGVVARVHCESALSATFTTQLGHDIIRLIDIFAHI
jgi:hypothetical protein